MNHITLMLAFLFSLILTPPVFADDHDEEEDVEELSSTEIIEFLEEHAPEIREELLTIQRHEPDEYENHLEELGDLIHGFREMKAIDPEVADALLQAERLERKSWKMAEAIGREKNADDRKEMIAELKAWLDEIFDARLKEGEMEIHQMEKELDELRTMLSRRRGNKDRIVKRRLDNMVEESSDEMGWW